MIELKTILDAALDYVEEHDLHPLRHFDPEDAQETARDAFPGIHPSDFKLNCNRALVYATVNAKRDDMTPEPDQEKTRKRTRIFDHGKMLHVLVQSYLLVAESIDLLDHVENEAPVGPRHNIVGTQDSLIMRGSHVAGVEIKSAGPTTYYGTKNIPESKGPITTATKAHRQQVSAYMLAAELDEFHFVYWDKAMDDWAILPFGRDEKLITEIRREAEFGLEAVDRGVLPGTIDNYWTCRGCPFRTVCGENKPLDEVDRRHLTP